LKGGGRQCHGEMPGVGPGLWVAGRSPGWQLGRIGRGSQSRDSQGLSRCGRSTEGRCRVEGGAFVPRWRGWKYSQELWGGIPQQEAQGQQQSGGKARPGGQDSQWLGGEREGRECRFSRARPDGRPCLEVRVGTRGPTMRTKSVGEEIVRRTTWC